jgi:hypothetical protein
MRIRPFAWGFAVRLGMATLGLAATMASASMLVACDDEEDPKTWVKRLDDPAQRANAIKRLTQFFEDDMTKASKNREDPTVQGLLNDIVDPMTKQYTAGQLDEKTRKDLMKFLADTRDPRTGPAIAKAFNEYEPGKNDEDVKYAAQAVKGLAEAKKLTDQTVKDALWACFAKFQVSKAKSINLVKDLHDAVVTVNDPSYGPKAVEKLAPPVDPKNVDSMKDQVQFWQLTSVQVIGNTKYTAGIKPLVTVLLTPTKSDLRSPVNTALLKMAKAAEPVLVSAMNGSDPDFAKLEQNPAWGDQKLWVAVVGDALAMNSRPLARDAYLAALAGADNDTNRAALAQSLVKFPSDPRLEPAFLGTYKKIPDGTEVQIIGGNAHGALAQASAQFYDAAIVDWLVKTIAAAKGEEADEIQLLALHSAIELMTPAQKAAVNASTQKEGTPIEKDMFTGAAKTLDKCGTDASCYVGILDQPIPTTGNDAKMAVAKAAYMAGMYGNDATRAALVTKVDKVKDGRVRVAVVEAIDHLAPKGDPAAADALQKVVEADTAAGNAGTYGDDVVEKVALRLRGRAD